MIDKEGNIASFDINRYDLRIGYYDSGYGVLLNTTMDGFDVVDGGINEITIKRPLSNMAPTIVMHHGSRY